MQPDRLLRTIVVLYHPDDAAIGMTCALARDGHAPIAVINAIDPGRLAALRGAHVDTVVNETNAGLARAFNQGIEYALRSGARYVMLLDQDTRPTATMIGDLLTLAERATAAGRAVGCIGPVPVDRKLPDARTLARPVRNGAPGEADLTEVATIISSGMLIPHTALARIGGMWDELFIDQIDHEWCFRARAAGLMVAAAPAVPMPHDMGDRGFRILGRYKPVHRSPLRHYHIVRNTLWLARCSFIPARWRMGETAKLAVRIPSYLLFSSAPGQSWTAMLHGLRDGLRGVPRRSLHARLVARTDPSTI